MTSINWITTDLKEIYVNEKQVYELKGKPYVVKKILDRNVDADELLKRLNYLKERIPGHVPETQFIRACDEKGTPWFWVVQEKINGRHLDNLSLKDMLFHIKEIASQYRELLDRCPNLDDFEKNFIWDNRKKKLFYVDFVYKVT